MCFRWLKRLWHCLRHRRRRSRGYSRDLSLSHRGFCSGSSSDPRGRSSFTCAGDTALTWSRRASPGPALPPCAISGGFSCDIDGSLEFSAGLAPSWDPSTAGCDPRGGLGYSGEEPGYNRDRSGYDGEDSGGGSGVYHPSFQPRGDLGGARGGHGYPEGSGGVGGSGFGGWGQRKRAEVVPQMQQCKQNWLPLQKK